MYDHYESKYKDILKNYKDRVFNLEMEQYLFDHHEELALEYSQRLSLQNLTDEKILRVIIQFLTERNEMDLKEMKQDLLGIAAVYGGLFIKGNESIWKWNNKYNVSTIFIKKGIKKITAPLDIVTSSRKTKRYNYLIEHYEDMKREYDKQK